MQERVICVDEQDRMIDTCEKLQAHREGRLHRAFSVLLFRKQAQGWFTLLQQRQYGKYHGGGLWSNSCCSHPRVDDEDVMAAAQRRMGEELGLAPLPLHAMGTIRYHLACGPDLSEHELDHLFIGRYDDDACPYHLSEVRGVRWIAWEQLIEDLNSHPHRYTPWLPLMTSTLDRRDVQAALG